MNNLCEQCKGACCKCKLFSTDWLQKSGAKSVHYKGEEDNKVVNGYTQIHKTCPHLSQDGTCDIYETRPQVCKNFLVGSENCLIVMKIMNPKLYNKLQRDEVHI